MTAMAPRRLGLWVLLATAGVIGLLLAYAGSTGAWGYMAARMGPAWWLMPTIMLLAMAVVMLAMMWPMMSMGVGTTHHGAQGDALRPADAAALAAHRYAAGEISRNDYLRIREDLVGGGLK